MITYNFKSHTGSQIGIIWGEGCPFQVQDEILILYIFGVHFPVLVSFAEPAFGVLCILAFVVGMLWHM